MCKVAVLVASAVFLFASVVLAAGPAPDEIKAGTGLAQAYYLQGEAEPDHARRVAYLDKAIAAADHVLGAEPGAAHALYWRSMSYLLKAEVVGGLKALRLVKQALRDLEFVASKDPAYDSAGAYRSRGKVLIDAPSWAFIGDKKKGLELLVKAKGIAPTCLINRLYLAQAYVKNGRPGEARAELDYIRADRSNTKDDLKIKDDAGRLRDELDKAGR